jgi:2'-5' RNA ligase
MKTFHFHVTLVGSGFSAEEAWEDAKETFFTDDDGVPEHEEYEIVDNDENTRAENSWEHIWALDALFAVLHQHVDDVATTTSKDGFSMEFRKNGTSVCGLDSFENRPRTLFVNVAVSRELWFALLGIAHQHQLEFAEFEEPQDADGTTTETPHV